MKHSLLKNACPRSLAPGHHSRDGTMYGMLLESIQHFVSTDLGVDTWLKILDHAGCKNMVFSTHHTYSDDIMLQLAKSCHHVTNTLTVDQWMTHFGKCFVEFCSEYGYDRLLGVAGRHYRDFLHGIDNIHEMIRFSYPQLQSPSFIVISEDVEGCILLYQSKRQGFKHYVMGQLKQCAKRFYQVNVDVSIQEEVIVEKQCHVKFRLDFDNSPYQGTVQELKISGKSQYSSISGDIFFKVFPFCIVFNADLAVCAVGNSMAAFIKGDNLIGCKLPDKFHLRRPLIHFTWHKILSFQRVIFELEYCTSQCQCRQLSSFSNATGTSTDNGTRLLLRGQMKYMEDWKMMVFLCNPLLNNVEGMEKLGLYITDLNMFDNSREKVLAGQQHASQLECSIEQQQAYSEKISDNMEKAEQWKRCSENLLYSMIPRSIAERLKNGEDPINTCEVFENVTIMFSYMVDFSDICAQASPLQIVECMNSVFTLFDNIVDNYDVFKVETLGDAVYMVAGGVPDWKPNHAASVAGLALELLEQALTLKDPLTGNSLKTRIGMHTGSVVAGVVGRRMPQYCLFGDTVNTAARMQSYSMPNRVHISEPCNECLKGTKFVTLKRGKVNVKGKGEMRTYWLAGREGEERTQNFLEMIRNERCRIYQSHSSYENALDLHSMHATTSFSHITSHFSKISVDEENSLDYANTPLIQSPSSDGSRSPGVIRKADKLSIEGSLVTPISGIEDKELSPLCPFTSANHKLPTNILYQNGQHDDVESLGNSVAMETDNHLTTITSDAQSEKMFLGQESSSDFSLTLADASDNVQVCKFVLEPP